MSLQEDIDEYFGKYGTIKDSVIMVEKGTGKPRGFAFVEVTYELEGRTSKSLDLESISVVSNCRVGKKTEILKKKQ